MHSLCSLAALRSLSAEPAGQCLRLRLALVPRHCYPACHSPPHCRCSRRCLWLDSLRRHRHQHRRRCAQQDIPSSLGKSPQRGTGWRCGTVWTWARVPLKGHLQRGCAQVSLGRRRHPQTPVGLPWRTDPGQGSRQMPTRCHADLDPPGRQACGVWGLGQDWGRSWGLWFECVEGGHRQRTLPRPCPRGQGSPVAKATSLGPRGAGTVLHRCPVLHRQHVPQRYAAPWTVLHPRPSSRQCCRAEYRPAPCHRIRGLRRRPCPLAPAHLPQALPLHLLLPLLPLHCP